MIATVGDLVEDIVVRLGGPVQEASDTAAVVVRRRGGSAANMAVSVVRGGHPARFIGQVGNDGPGAALAEELRAEGVDVVVRRAGRTGTIVVLLDHNGERTMLTDRGACTALDQPSPAWLDGVDTLHVPVYSLIGDPLAHTTATLIAWAHDRSIRVSLDASSASVIDDFGAEALLELLAELRPSVLLCNELEAERLAGGVEPARIGAQMTVIKHGRDPAVILQPGMRRIEVPALALDNVRDTTGAGDAFAAGFLVALAGGASPVAAASFGHQSAARAIASASAST
ncbi:MAG TPA: carbohydrate kinase family protein [Ilumatobacteraceae bacterium]